MNDDVMGLLDAELSHPTLFDEGVEAARNACAAGASIAAAAITAAAYYDNPLTGLGALRALMLRLRRMPADRAAWRRALERRQHPETGEEFTPGFGFVTPDQGERVLAVCHRLASRLDADGGPRCRWMLEHHHTLSTLAGPLNGTGLAALVFLDRELDVEHAERRWLLCKLSVALGEAQRAQHAGVAPFPFSGHAYVYEGPQPAPTALDRAELLRRVGLEGADG